MDRHTFFSGIDTVFLHQIYVVKIHQIYVVIGLYIHFTANPQKRKQLYNRYGGVVLRIMVGIFWLFKFDFIILHCISILGIGTNRV